MADKHTATEAFESTEPLAQSPDEARVRATVLIYSHVPQIVEGLIRKAKSGSVNEARFLLDLFGMSSEAVEPRSPKASKSETKSSKKTEELSDDEIPPLARILMDTLDAIKREED